MNFIQKVAAAFARVLDFKSKETAKPTPSLGWAKSIVLPPPPENKKYYGIGPNLPDMITSSAFQKESTVEKSIMLIGYAFHKADRSEGTFSNYEVHTLMKFYNMINYSDYEFEQLRLSLIINDADFATKFLSPLDTRT